MLNPFCAAFLLTVEALRVIEMLLVRIAWGGTYALGCSNVRFGEGARFD